MTEEEVETQTPRAIRECISCGKILFSEDFGEVGPDEHHVHDGVYDGVYLRFVTDGNYGSSAFDMQGYAAEGFLCDECFIQKSNRLYAWTRGQEKVGQRISTLRGDHYLKLDCHGPAYLAKYVNGEHWVQGIRYYPTLSSEKRSEAETLLLADPEAETVNVPRELLDQLLGGLRSAENNAIERKEALRRAWGENETLKTSIASPPVGDDVESILLKEAEELNPKEIKRLNEYTRWAMNFMGWFREQDLQTADGTQVDTMYLWVLLTEGEEGVRRFRGNQEILDAYLKQELTAETSNETSEGEA